MKRIILFLGIAGYLTAGVDARDLGQWENADPAIRQWYQSLMQPDAPHASRCGEADAYWADSTSETARPTCASRTTGRMNRSDGLTSTTARPQRSRVLLRSARRRVRA